MKGKEVADLIDNAYAIVIDNDKIVYANIEDNEGLYNLNFTTEEELLMYSYSIKFWEDDEIEIVDNSFVLNDGESRQPVKISLLEIKKIK